MTTFQSRAIFFVAALFTTITACADPNPVCRDHTTDGSSSSASNRLPGVMYFNSKPKDSAQCSMRVVDGHLQVSAPISNPAMSCPDMAAWKLFADAVTQKFWENWAADQQTWPGQPLPICTSKGAANCCDPNAANNPGYGDKANPAQNCPYFPGDHLSANGELPIRVAGPMSKAHLTSFAHGVNIKLLAADETGRDIRQSMSEIVFRNKPMFEYVFENDLYHQEGVQAVFNRNSANISGQNAGLPYRLKAQDGGLTEIDLPVDSVMIKSDWLSKKRAEKLGLHDDPANPYIKMTIDTRATDNNGNIQQPGEHWLVAMHISSKDTPNWLWATWEHVNNPGRCDYIGCNDSYGYSTPDKIAANQADNYTTPNYECDDLDLASWVFKPNGHYDGGQRSKGMAEVFAGLGIGVHESSAANPKNIEPAIGDRAWLSYRLKGTQTEFTDTMGRPTHLANSVTEGGFVLSSSCVTCHARAGATAKGTIPLALGVFTNIANESGYLQSISGAPDPNLFNADNQPPALTVLQTDFIWGFLTATCLNGAPFPCGSSAGLRATAPTSTPRPSIRALIPH